MGITEAHWLTSARRVPSPNADARPENAISLIVIHCISLPENHFGNRHVEQLFCNSLSCSIHPDFDDLESLCVSSHLFIRRSGEVCQFVPFDQRAWHAGVSNFRGRAQCNDFSIGIELEGTDKSRYRDIQYQVLAGVCREVITRYDIPAANIVGHSDIAPGRKSDPGTEFDWPRLRRAVAESGG